MGTKHIRQVLHLKVWEEKIYILRFLYLEKDSDSTKLSNDAGLCNRYHFIIWLFVVREIYILQIYDFMYCHGFGIITCF